MAKNTFMSSVWWSYLGEFSSRLAPPVTMLLAARFLSPSDFGIVTAVLIVTTFCQLFWEAGLGKALIQRPMDLGVAFNFAVAFNSTSALAICLVIWFFAEQIAVGLLNDLRAAGTLRWMVIFILCSALSSAPIALLQKRMDFKRLFYVKFFPAWSSLLVSLTLLYKGVGYMALVYGFITSSVLQLLFSARFLSTYISCGFETRVGREMLSFSVWVFITSFLSWMFLWLDSIIVARWLGATDLGVYRMANQIAMFGMMLIFIPVQPVLFSELSRLQESAADMDRYAKRTLSWAALVATPVSVFLAYFSHPFVNFLLGQSWSDVPFIFSMLILMHGVSWIVGFNGDFYRAIGKPKLETLINSIVIFIYLGVYLWIVRLGLEQFSIARFGLSLVAFLGHLFLFTRYFNVNIKSLFVNILTYSMWSLLVCIVLNELFTQIFNNSSDIFRLISILIILCLNYIYLIKLKEPELFRLGLNFIKRKRVNGNIN